MATKFDSLYETDLTIWHRRCGNPINILSLNSHSSGVTVRGFCTTCGRYVKLMMRAKRGKFEDPPPDQVVARLAPRTKSAPRPSVR